MHRRVDSTPIVVKRGLTHTTTPRDARGDTTRRGRHVLRPSHRRGGTRRRGPRRCGLALAQGETQRSRLSSQGATRPGPTGDRRGHRTAQGAHVPSRGHRAPAGPTRVHDAVVDGRRLRRDARGGTQRSRRTAVQGEKTRGGLRRVHRSRPTGAVQSGVPRQQVLVRAQARAARLRARRRGARHRTRPIARRRARQGRQRFFEDARPELGASTLRCRAASGPRERRRGARQDDRRRRGGRRERRARGADGTRALGRARPAPGAVGVARPVPLRRVAPRRRDGRGCEPGRGGTDHRAMRGARALR